MEQVDNFFAKVLKQMYRCKGSSSIQKSIKRPTSISYNREIWEDFMWVLGTKYSRFVNQTGSWCEHRKEQIHIQFIFNSIQTRFNNRSVRSHKLGSIWEIKIDIIHFLIFALDQTTSTGERGDFVRQPTPMTEFTRKWIMTKERLRRSALQKNIYSLRFATRKCPWQ